MKSEFDLILKLSKFPSSVSEIDISDYSEKKIIKLLADNQVLLPFFKNLDHFSNPELSFLKNTVEKMLKKDYLVNPEEKLLFTFSIFSELNIKFMLHKYIFYEREQGDIDILVPENDFDFVISELKKRGFSITSSESFKLGMTKYQKNEKFTIHVHAKIKWESEFISTYDVWKRSRTISLFDNLVIIPSPEDSVLIECAHASFEARLIRLCDLLQFLGLLNHDLIDWEKVVLRLIQYRYHSAGYLYFLAMNHLSKKLFDTEPIPKKVLDSLEKEINGFEKLTTNRAKKLILSNNEKTAPLRMSLILSALLFISFNKHLGIKKFFWSTGVIASATIRLIQVKLKLRKL